MRLTLRTLLAYLDDVLEPAQTKEIGQKIKESSVATDLVERIRDVMRRRRLTSPELDDATPQGNANTVAEYLDNILTPDQVTQLERVCLESDVNLAEVAAAHQILSLVLGEPVSVPTSTKERMYSLVGTKELSDSKTAVSTYQPPSNAAERVASLGGSGVIPKGVLPAESASNTSGPKGNEVIALPEEIRPIPMWKWAALWGAATVVLVLWLAVTFGDQEMWDRLVGGGKSTDAPVLARVNRRKPGVVGEVERTSRPKVEESDENVKPVEPATGATEGESAKGTEPSLGEGKPNASPEMVENGNSNSGEKPIEPETAAKEKPESPALAGEKGNEEPAKPDSDGVPAPVGEQNDKPEVAKNSSDVPSETGQPEEVAKSTAESKEPGELPGEEKRLATAAEYRSSDGILLFREKEGNEWRVKPHHAALREGEYLAVPEPFDALLTTTGGGHSLMVQSKSVLQWIGPKAKADAGVMLKRGRIAFHPKAGGEKGNGGNPDEQTPFGVTITVGLESWLIQISDSEAVSGVEVIPYEPQKFEEGVIPDRAVVRLCVAKGSVQFARLEGPVTEDQFRVVDGPMTIRLPSKYAGGEAVDSLMSELSVEGQPDLRGTGGGRLSLGYEWLNDQRSASQKNRISKTLDKEFEPAVDGSIEPVMLQVSKDRVALLAKLATSSLGLVGDYRDLVAILQKTEHSEVRREAIQELRIWLPEAPENGRLLQDELSVHFSPEDSAVLYQLLWGYEMSAGSDPKVSALLVKLLADPNDSIRELAFLHVRRLTNNRLNDYRPNSPEKVRQIGINNWKRHLEKNKGTLVEIPEQNGQIDAGSAKVKENE